MPDRSSTSNTSSWVDQLVKSRPYSKDDDSMYESQNMIRCLDTGKMISVDEVNPPANS